jgi:hypothetical protein
MYHYRGRAQIDGISELTVQITMFGSQRGNDWQVENSAHSGAAYSIRV